ncbi:MAG TPA: nucleotide exchange factor GrpE [Candidatus Baltobacteraceae bacterium]|jgi:molecular chaperone GrpE (heat shock protein)|nr:nucleotide exchange factor GrpE [Candidatus Baltobacteraceae bacterium]
MTDVRSNLPLWPFLAADALFVGAGGLLLWLGHRPLLWWEASLMVVCVAGAAGSFIFPFVRRNSDEQSLAQARLLADATRQLQNIDQVAAQITGATDQWRQHQEQISQSTATAKGVAESMAAEARSFTEFLQKAGDTERAHLRLEVEKLRRAEADWLQIMIHILDHVFALFQAAHRSGQPALAEQMNLFQNTCRDAARRIGLVATKGKTGDPFDPALHRLADDASPNGNAIVGETLATGYTFQGQIIRRPLVALQAPPLKTPAPS